MLRKNRPFSVLQHQAQFDLNPALVCLQYAVHCTVPLPTVCCTLYCTSAYSMLYIVLYLCLQYAVHCTVPLPTVCCTLYCTCAYSML